MTLKEWLVFFICSMAFSAEVLAWAVQHGQFRHVNRGRWMPLRSGLAPGREPRRRPWTLGIYLFAMLVMAVAVGRTLYWMVSASYFH